MKKENNIIDYEKKYKEALERTEALIAGETNTSDALFYLNEVKGIFDELQESRDEWMEKIRKELLSYLGNRQIKTLVESDVVEIWRTWLEKQGQVKEYTFKSIPRLLEMVEPTERAKVYCQKLIDTLVKEGYATDAKIIGEYLKQMNGEKVALATMDDQKINKSEDERIRKAILNYLIKMWGNSQDDVCGVHVEDAIAWLEKQNKQKPYGQREECLDCQFNYAGHCKGYCELKRQDKSTFEQCKQEGDRITTNSDGTHFNLSQLERVAKAETPEESLGVSSEKYSEIVDECIYGDDEKNSTQSEEQEPTDKVEPKFKDGDWVIYKNDICQIVKREEGCNKLVTTFGIEKELINERNLSTARLWTIKDAKDGDVLAEDSCIFIIQKLGDNSTAAKTYCTLYNDGDFDDGSILYFDVDSTYPATKEQRDLLFQKMREAGYKWDEKNKELKKIKTSEKSLGISSEKYNEIVDECIYRDDERDSTQCEKQELTNESESKFKDDDWIVNLNDNSIAHIVKVRVDYYASLRYNIEHSNGDISSPLCIFADDAYRLWTIKDAKDGDVLAAYECYVIFKEIDGLNIKCYCTYHYMNNPSFHVDTLQNKDAFHPATKEQRDQLEKAMVDAGYKWDKEKKKLIKIKQISKWTEEDEKAIRNKIAHEIAWESTKHYDPTLNKENWCEMAVREAIDRIGGEYLINYIQGYKNAIKDACKWLNDRYHDYGYLDLEDITTMVLELDK